MARITRKGFVRHHAPQVTVGWRGVRTTRAADVRELPAQRAGLHEACDPPDTTMSSHDSAMTAACACQGIKTAIRLLKHSSVTYIGIV